jgi:hypothetical protein
MNIISKETGEVIGTVITTQRLTLDQAFELAGFEWHEYEPENGFECRGWYKDGVLYDESVAELAE